MRIKSWRNRQTGPEHSLAVIHCRTHRVCFTLYPPGFTPYGRVPLVRLSPDGQPVERESDGQPFEGTLFQAVLDGCRGIAWPKESCDDSMHPRFITQQRHINRCILLLGLARGSPISCARALQVLRLPGLDIQQAREWVAGMKGFRHQSAATYKILAQLKENLSSFHALVTHAYDARLWARKQVPVCSGIGNATAKAS